MIVNIGGKNYTGKIVDGKVELDVKDLPTVITSPLFIMRGMVIIPDLPEQS